MPRCLRFHKVPPSTGFCAVCGARVLPGWIWLCLFVLPFALIYGTAVSWWIVTQYPIPIETIEVTRIITATEPASTPTRPGPTPTPSPTRTFTPTPSRTWTPTNTASPTASATPSTTPSPTASATPTATLFPRFALKSYHGLYVIAKEEEDGWVLRQATMSDNECMWFTLVSYEDGRISLKACGDQYVTASMTGNTRWDWRLRLTTTPDECVKFTTLDYGKDRVAFKTCGHRYFTAGDGNWTSAEKWLVISETNVVKDWEIFKLQPP